MTNERRVAARKKEVLEARIFFNNRRSGFNCVVQDFSSSGARISVTDLDRVPDEFELYVPVKQKAFPARVRWRRKNEIGLIFSQPVGAGGAQVAAAVGDLNKRIEKLEADVASLTQRVSDLTREIHRSRP